MIPAHRIADIEWAWLTIRDVEARIRTTMTMLTNGQAEPPKTVIESTPTGSSFPRQPYGHDNAQVLATTVLDYGTIKFTVYAGTSIKGHLVMPEVLIAGAHRVDTFAPIASIATQIAEMLRQIEAMT